jgi:activator of HSP90 ATPase
MTYYLEHSFTPMVKCWMLSTGLRRIIVSKRPNVTPLASTSTRRQAIAGLGIALGSMAAGPTAWGKAQQQTMKEMPGTEANRLRTSIHQEVDFKTSPERIYGALLGSKQFASFTGMPAEIDPKAGGAFSMFGGLVVGRNVELISNQRVVQAWRPTHWDSGVYSIVRFELKAQDSETKLLLDHCGFPEGEFDHLDSGWKMRYWEPLKKFLA